MPGSDDEADTLRSAAGGLGITERRSWATWQLVVAIAVSSLLGMIIAYSGKKTSSASAAGGGAIVSLARLGGTTTTVNATTKGAASNEAGTTTTTTTTTTDAPGQDPGSTTSTSSAVTSSTTIVNLEANTMGTGPMALATFRAGATWSIGWVYTCVGAAGGSGTFSITVITDPSGIPAPTPAVEQSGRSSQGITPQTTAGSQHLRVDTDPACRWAVHVTGVAP